MRRWWVVLGLVGALLAAPLPPRAGAQPVGPFVPPAMVYPYNLPHLGLIEQATFVLYERFFEPIDSAAFFGAAITAADEELARQGVHVKLRAVTFSGHPPADWELFAQAYAGVATGYADQIDGTALSHAVLRAMARSLNDCHTFFLPATSPNVNETRARVQGEAQGQGIGIAVVWGEDGYPILEDVFKDAPAFSAGLRAGDRLLAVDGQDLRGLSTPQLAPRLREPLGTPVKLTVARHGQPTTEIEVVRSRFTPPVLDTRLLDGGVGYIRIYGFSPRLDSRALHQAHADMTGQGATSFVLDLRNNPGGSGQAAVALLSALVGRDVLLFSNVGRDGSVVPMFAADQPWSSKGKLALLVNERSISAAEVVAAVAQDFGSARLFGTQTKGCLAAVDMQRLFDGSTLGVTTARVVTAKGRSLNRIGVMPDIGVDRSLAHLVRGEDPQLDRAVAWLRE